MTEVCILCGKKISEEDISRHENHCDPDPQGMEEEQTMKSHDEFNALVKSIVELHREHGIMTIDLSDDNGISLLRGYLADAHMLGMRHGVDITRDAQRSAGL